MHYIIEFTSESTQQQREEYLNSLSCEVTKTWDNFSETVMVTSESPLPESPVVSSIVNDEEAIISPLAYPQMLDIDRKLIFRDSDSNIPEVTFSTTEQRDWWKNYIQFKPEFEAETMSIPRRGYKVPVYILDSGITHDHSEFANVDVENVWTVTPNDYSDPNGHGTAIASVISGETCGLAASPLKIVKIFRDDRGTYLSEFLDALNAVLNHIDPGKLAVVNCSWSILQNDLIDNKFKKMIDRGIQVVASAGNSGIPIENVTPASIPEVLAVGSYGIDLVPSDFSNYQETSEISYTAGSVNSGPVNIWAPGEYIWAATKEGGFGYTAGTSMSAGIASMVLSYRFTDFIEDDGYPIDVVKDKKIYLTWSKEDEKTDPIANDGPFIVGVTGNIDLLDLSDPKYNNARNFIITILGTFKDYIGFEFSNKPEHPVDKLTAYVRAGKKNYVTSLYTVVKSAKEIWLMSPLPERCSVSKDATIIIDQPVVSALTEDEFLDTYSLYFKAVFEDNTETEIEVEVKVVPADLVTEDLPEDHEISILLASVCNTVVGFCPDGFASVCSDSCGGLGICCRFFGFKGNQTCQCESFS